MKTIKIYLIGLSISCTTNFSLTVLWNPCKWLQQTCQLKLVSVSWNCWTQPNIFGKLFYKCIMYSCRIQNQVYDSYLILLNTLFKIWGLRNFLGIQMNRWWAESSQNCRFKDKTTFGQSLPKRGQNTSIKLESSNKEIEKLNCTLIHVPVNCVDTSSILKDFAGV